MINWHAITLLLWVIAGGLDIGWSVEYFYNKKYIRGGVFMMCAIGCIVYFIKELMFYG